MLFSGTKKNQRSLVRNGKKFSHVIQLRNFTKTASIVGSWHTDCKSKVGRGSCGGDFRSIANDGGDKLLAGSKLMLLDSDRFDATPFSFELNDNMDESTESVSSTGKSRFGIVVVVMI